MSEHIEKAPGVNVEQYDDIAEDFIPAIFGIQEWLLTDESMLDDFVPFDIVDEKVVREQGWFEKVRDKVEKKYGIDISDMKGSYLWEIFRKIRVRTPQ